MIPRPIIEAPNAQLCLLRGGVFLDTKITASASTALRARSVAAPGALGLAMTLGHVATGPNRPKSAANMPTASPAGRANSRISPSPNRASEPSKQVSFMSAPRPKAMAPMMMRPLTLVESGRVAFSGHVRQGGVISAVAVGHRQAALAVMFRGWFSSSIMGWARLRTH